MPERPAPAGLFAWAVPGAALSVRHGDQTLDLQLQIGGGHAALNALAALAGIAAAGGSLERAIGRIEQLRASDGRGRVHDLRRNIRVVDDSYNASPSALASVLETLRASDPRGRRVLVTGDMLELGPLEVALHREVGRLAGASSIGMVIAVGNLSRATAARMAGVGEVHHFADSEQASKAITELLSDGDLIVVKGSRGIRMEKVVDRLVEHLAVAEVES